MANGRGDACVNMHVGGWGWSLLMMAGTFTVGMQVNASGAGI